MNIAQILPTILPLFLALIIDGLLGDPVYPWHPVRLMGLLIARLDKDLYPNSKTPSYLLTAGAILTGAVVLTVAIIYGTLGHIMKAYMGLWAILPEALLIYQLLATRCLWDEGRRILRVLATGDLTLARKEIGYLVSRDTENLTAEAISKAAVETMTENLTDAIVAPLFYYSLFGLPGLAIYKAINTMDSMIGYKNDRYLYFGRVAARLDDVANFIPARIGVVLIWIVALIRGHKKGDSLRCVFMHRRFHASPNSGCTEAAMAGALGIQLSGPTIYFGKLTDRPYIGFVGGPVLPKHLNLVLGYVVFVGVLASILALALRVAMFLGGSPIL